MIFFLICTKTISQEQKIKIISDKGMNNRHSVEKHLMLDNRRIVMKKKTLHNIR